MCANPPSAASTQQQRTVPMPNGPAITSTVRTALGVRACWCSHPTVKSGEGRCLRRPRTRAARWYRDPSDETETLLGRVGGCARAILFVGIFQRVDWGGRGCRGGAEEGQLISTALRQCIVPTAAPGHGRPLLSARRRRCSHSHHLSFRDRWVGGGELRQRPLFRCSFPLEGGQPCFLAFTW